MCQASLLKFPLTTPAKFIAGFQQRLQNLCTSRHLPRVSPAFFEDVEGSEGKLGAMVRHMLAKKSAAISDHKMLNDVLYGSTKLPEIGRDTYQCSLALLAMCGWDCPADRGDGAGGDASASHSVSSPRSPRMNANSNARRRVLQCALCGSRAGVWNFDKHVERPCQLDYLTLTLQSAQEGAGAAQGSGGGDGGHDADSLPTHSLRGTAGATGYTCLTSPMYVASPTVVNLHRTIAGGDTIASFGLQPDLPAGAPAADISNNIPGASESAKKSLELNTRDPRLCRSAAMHPLNAHRKYVHFPLPPPLSLIFGE